MHKSQNRASKSSLLRERVKQVANFFRTHPKLWHLLVILTYFLFTFYYMTPQALHCDTTVYGFGDNTAGPIWRSEFTPNTPLGGYETKTNYPFGENVYTPASYSAVIQYTANWGLSKVAGPLCGYNMITFGGFIISAIVMYGFIYAVTKKRSIAWLAGFAASFSPYYQLKSGNHMGYGYQALLIGIIWAFYNLVKYRKKRHAVVLGALVATCFYFDPYFSLLAATCLAGVGAAWAIIEGWRVYKHRVAKSAIFQQIRLLLLSAGVGLLLLLPLAAIAVTQSQQINASVSASRGNVLYEARACSVLPYQFAVPFVLNPIFTRLFGGSYYKVTVDNLNNHFPCGIGESAVGVSFAIIGIVGIATVVFAWERLNKRRLKLNKLLGYDPSLLIFGIAALGIVAVVMALPPIKLGPIPLPSYMLLMITTTWRTILRFYVVVNISAVVLCSIALAYFGHHFRQHKKIIIALFVALFLAIFVEYQAFKPFAGNTLSNFTYNKDVPSAYVWLGEQEDIKAVAEYPIERAGGESDAASYYLSMQLAHKKPLLNSVVSTSEQESVRSSIRDLSDPQTIPVLEKLGIDTVVIHGVSAEEVAKIPNLTVVYESPQSSYNILAHTPTVKNDTIVIARLNKTTTQNRMLQLQKDQFPRNSGIIISSLDWQYEALQDAQINIAPVVAGEQVETGPIPVCFAVRTSVPSEKDQLTLIVDGQPSVTIPINGTYQDVKVWASQTVVLHNQSGSNMQIKDIGCPLN